MLNFKNYIINNLEEVVIGNYRQRIAIGKQKELEIMKIVSSKLNWEFEVASEFEDRNQGIDFWVTKYNNNKTRIPIQIKSREGSKYNTINWETIKPFYDELKNEYAKNHSLKFTGKDMKCESKFICFLNNLGNEIFFFNTEEIKENAKFLTYSFFEKFISSGDNSPMRNSSGYVSLIQDPEFESNYRLKGEVYKILCGLNINSLKTMSNFKI